VLLLLGNKVGNKILLLVTLSLLLATLSLLLVTLSLLLVTLSLLLVTLSLLLATLGNIQFVTGQHWVTLTMLPTGTPTVDDKRQDSRQNMHVLKV
jgi:hypothetical protein